MWVAEYDRTVHEHALAISQSPSLKLWFRVECLCGSWSNNIKSESEAHEWFEKHCAQPTTTTFALPGSVTEDEALEEAQISLEEPLLGSYRLVRVFNDDSPYPPTTQLARQLRSIPGGTQVRVLIRVTKEELADRKSWYNLNLAANAVMIVVDEAQRLLHRLQPDEKVVEVFGTLVPYSLNRRQLCILDKRGKEKAFSLLDVIEVQPLS